MGNKCSFRVTRLHRAALPLLLLLALAGKGEAQSEAPVSAKSKASATILAVPVKSFKVDNASMPEALLKLRSSDVSRIVIGFERIPHREDGTGGPISMTLADTTLGEVVRSLCQADPRYEYEVIDGQTMGAGYNGSMIEVRPKGAIHNREDLLNIKVKDYKVDARNAGAIEAIEHIKEDAPELRAFLQQKHEEWVKKTGRQPGGSAGSIMSGNMPPPPFVLELHNVTVRQILDAVSLKSIQIWGGGQTYNASGMPTKWSPTGWEYDFIIDANAPTGLGGYPEWKPL